MQQRFLSWLLLCAFAAVTVVRAQLPEVKGGAERVFPAKITGTVTKTIDGATTPLVEKEDLPQKAKINTAANSSVVLVFSNGATVQIGADSELIIEEYLQNPFNTSVNVATATDEPSPSKTRLSLNRGELVGNVKKLKYSEGSTFTIQTPVGAAGIRGTTFRIVFRPSGTGQAFFTLSTATGNVTFAQPGAGNGNPGVTGSGVVTGLPVPSGQEIALTVNVTQNAQGQLVVTVQPPTVTGTTNISAANLQIVTKAASDIATAVQQTVITPPGGGPPPRGPQGIQGENFSGEAKNQQPPGATQAPRITSNPGKEN